MPDATQIYAQRFALDRLFRAPHFGPYRAPDNRLGDRDPITDGGRVMCGLERAVDYNSSPVIGRSVCARGSDYRVPSTRRYVSRVAHGMIVGSLFRVMRSLVI
jgi:hypothetical protein